MSLFGAPPPADNRLEAPAVWTLGGAKNRPTMTVDPALKQAAAEAYQTLVPPPAVDPAVAAYTGLADKLPPPTPAAPDGAGAPGMAPGGMAGNVPQQSTGQPQNQSGSLEAALWRQAGAAAMQSSPGAYVPGGVQLEGYQVQRGPQLSDEAVSDLRMREEGNREAIIAEAAAKREDTRVQVEKAVQEAEAAAAAAREAEREAATIDAETQRRIQRADAIRQQAADTIVQTPSEFWESRGSGARAMATIATALDSFGAGLTGREATVGKDIIAMVDAELAAQEKRRKMLGAEADQMQNSADAYAALYGTPAAQKAAKRQLALESQVKTIQAMAQAKGIPLQDASLDVLTGQLLAASQKEQAVLEAEQAGAVTESYRNVPGQYVGGRSANPAKAAEYERKAREAEGGDMSGFKTPDGQWRYPVVDPFTGEVGAASNEAQMRSSADRYKAAQNVASITGRMRAIVERNKGKAYMDSRDANQLAELRSQLTATKSVALDQGAMTDDEFSRNVATLPPDAASWTKRSHEANLAGISQVEGTFVDAYKRSAGATLHRTGQRINALTPTLQLTPEQ